MFLLFELLSKISSIHTILLKKRLFINKSSSYEQLLVSPVVSHAFATSLSVILCNVELALTNQSKNKKQLLKDAYVAAKRIDSLIRNNDSIKNKKFDFKKSLEKIKIISKIKHNSIIFTHYNHPQVYLYGNMLLFEEALLCLLNNAAEAYNNTIKAKVVIIYSVLQQNYLKVIIQDFGLGMNFLAQKVATLKGVSYREKGTGIGLPFARTVIEKKFQGTLTIESKFSEGTKITLWIPLKSAVSIRIPLRS